MELKQIGRIRSALVRLEDAGARARKARRTRGSSSTPRSRADEAIDGTQVVDIKVAL
ncbi:MAG TPA: hypothetical protein VH439_02110 [Gemmatimonadales bacterium]